MSAAANVVKLSGQSNQWKDRRTSKAEFVTAAAMFEALVARAGSCKAAWKLCGYKHSATFMKVSPARDGYVTLGMYNAIVKAHGKAFPHLAEKGPLELNVVGGPRQPTGTGHSVAVDSVLESYDDDDDDRVAVVSIQTLKSWIVAIASDDGPMVVEEILEYV